MRRVLRYCDKPLLISLIIFSLLGLLMVFSASSIISAFSESVSPYYYFYRQLIFVLSSYFAGFFVLSRYKLKNYGKIVTISFPIIVILLIGLFIFAEDINGAKSWYDLGLFNFQPSEIAKVYVIMFIAYFFDQYQKNSKNVIDKKIMIPLIVSLVIIGLIFLQPDLGTALIIGSSVIILYFMLPLNKSNRRYLLKVMILSLIIILGGVLLFKDKILSERQLARFTYQYPCERYADNTGYQVCNSFIAINNGGLFGVKLGNSTQKYLYLPAAHTDFIFAIIVEELGSIAGVLIILLYLYMLYRIYRISKRTYYLRDSIIVTGAMIIFSLHIITNLGGVTGLLPLTGVPLPFLSYGGSFTISCYMLIFLVQQVAIENNESRLKKEINNY